MSIQNDVLWTELIIGVSKDAVEGLGFFKRYKKNFTLLSPYHLNHLHANKIIM